MGDKTQLLALLLPHASQNLFLFLVAILLATLINHGLSAVWSMGYHGDRLGGATADRLDWLYPQWLSHADSG